MVDGVFNGRHFSPSGRSAAASLCSPLPTSPCGSVSGSKIFTFPPALSAFPNSRRPTATENEWPAPHPVSRMQRGHSFLNSSFPTSESRTAMNRRICCLGPIHCLNVILCIRKDFLLPRILLLFLRPLEDVSEDQHVHCNGQNGDKALCCRICSCRHDATHCRGNATLTVYRCDGGESAGILEQREYLREHAPKRQGVGPVLNPAALVPQRRRERDEASDSARLRAPCHLVHHTPIQLRFP